MNFLVKLSYLSKVTRMVFVHVDSVMMFTTSITTTSRMLAVLTWNITNIVHKHVIWKRTFSNQPISLKNVFRYFLVSLRYISKVGCLYCSCLCRIRSNNNRSIDQYRLCRYKTFAACFVIMLENKIWNRYNKLTDTSVAMAHVSSQLPSLLLGGGLQRNNK